MSEGRSARILVTDDDPVSLRFLAAALNELGCDVDTATSGAAALDACRASPFELLLLDRRMPDIGGAALLQALRAQGCTAAAIATSAELDTDMRAELHAAGYAGSVEKPIGIEGLAVLLATHLPHPHRPPPPIGAAASPATSGAATAQSLLDDDAALSSVGGDRQILQGLRGLLAAELEAALPRIAALPANEFGDWLHRLRASCRYCGAARLGELARQLESELKQSGSVSVAGIRELIDTVSATIPALGPP